MKSKRQNLNSATKPNKEPKLSRTHAPADLSPVDWQRGLRRQFGREQAFGLENLSSEPFFSEFRVSNPVSKSSYRVAIRGLGPGGNFCSCPDYATSELGTCKHIEFTLARLEKKRGAKTAFARGYQPAFSELYLRNDGKRSVHFRAGTDCPPALKEAAAGLFDAEHRRDAAGRAPRRARAFHGHGVASPATSCAPTTTRSISSRDGGMRTGGRRSSRSCSRAALPIPSCWRF